MLLVLFKAALLAFPFPNSTLVASEQKVPQNGLLLLLFGLIHTPSRQVMALVEGLRLTLHKNRHVVRVGVRKVQLVGYRLLAGRESAEQDASERRGK